MKQGVSTHHFENNKEKGTRRVPFSLLFSKSAVRPEHKKIIPGGDYFLLKCDKPARVSAQAFGRWGVWVVRRGESDKLSTAVRQSF